VHFVSDTIVGELPAQSTTFSLKVKLSLCLINILYPVMTLPPLYEAIQLITTLDSLIVVVTDVGSLLTLASRMEISSEKRLIPTEFLACSLNLYTALV